MLIYVNNRFVPADEACISVAERGFRFGDGVFETIRVENATPWLWQAHLARLETGLAALRIPAETLLEKLPELCARLIAENRLTQGILRIHVSRGIGSRGYLPEVTGEPCLVLETFPLPSPPAPISLWASGVEKISPRALPSQAKLTQGVNATLALLEAQAQGCAEALQCDVLGRVSETASANLFWLKDGRLYTPSLATGCLPGTVRARLLTWQRYPIEEGEYILTDLMAAEAVMITNSARLALAVERLQPHGVLWRSETLAEAARSWLMQDIAHDTAHFRW